MSFIIRKGTAGDLDMIERLYGEVCDHMAATVNYCGWKRDVYPARQDAEAGIGEGALFLAEADGEAAGSFILRPKQEDAYTGGTWQAALEERDVLTVYTFAVHPERRGQGVGRAMLEFAVRGEPPGDTAVRVRRVPVRGHRQPGAGGHRPGLVPAV